MAEKTLKGGSPAPKATLEEEVGYALAMLRDIQQKMGGSPREDRQEVVNTKQGDSLTDLVGAAFEQLMFLEDDVRTGEGHVRRLLGWDDNAMDKNTDMRSPEPEPDDIRSKLRAILGFIGRIRETQCRVNERLAYGV